MKWSFGKEQIMKTSATSSLARLAGILGVAGSLAATCGSFYSDESLKQEIQSVEGALAKLGTLQTA